MCLTCKTFAPSCENDNEWFDLNLFITFWELFARVDTSVGSGAGKAGMTLRCVEMFLGYSEWKCAENSVKACVFDQREAFGRLSNASELD